MKIIIAFDSFKGSLTAEEACYTAACAIQHVDKDAEIVEIPLSDGGEGLTKCIEKFLPTSTIQLEVHGPLMKKLRASYALSRGGTTAYMEMASASGLTLVAQKDRNPLITTTYGVGEMIADAIKRGCKHIIMGIGGSATCDGGIGMIKALEDHKSLNCKCKITVACDVTNPLYGYNGAAYVFGPQKGATAEQVVELDNRLKQFALETEKKGLATKEMAHYPGAGAAGGLGYALLTYLKAELKSGIDTILELSNFGHELIDSDLIITGEGKSDNQTMMGKVPYGVLRLCKQKQKPVWLISGAIDDATGELSSNFDLVKSINEDDTRPLNTLMHKKVALANLYNCVQKYFKCFKF